MSDSYGFRAGRARAFALGRHVCATLSAQGLIEPLSGAFAQIEWYRGLSFVSRVEAAAFFLFTRQRKLNNTLSFKMCGRP